MSLRNTKLHEATDTLLPLRIFAVFSMSSDISVLAHSYLHGPDDLQLSRGFENVAFATQQQLQVACHIATGDIHTRNGVLHGKALVHGHSVCDAVATVKHGTRRATRSVAAGERALKRVRKIQERRRQAGGRGTSEGGGTRESKGRRR